MNHRILKTFTSVFVKRSFCSRERMKLMNKIKVMENDYTQDEWTNVTPKIISYMNKTLHLRTQNPLCLVKERIVRYFQTRYTKPRGNPEVSVHENLSPVVSLEQNFDSLLVSKDHPSRKQADSYYINSEYMLRAHMTAHDRDLIKSGLDNFLVVGDVYRRDTIDSMHFPIFHQLDGVRLLSDHQIFKDVVNGKALSFLESVPSGRTELRQEHHSLEAVKLMEHDLKSCLAGLVQAVFGKDVKYRWTDTYFPFTHPSWELEVLFKDEWVEMLGCGILEHRILESAGASNKIGWAFGLGLERIAMRLYGIPDIRLIWSRDASYLWQFRNATPCTDVQFQPISKFPEYYNDISFWVPDDYESNDFFDMVRNKGGDIVERVELVDEFVHKTTQKRSMCYRIVYRHMEKTLTQADVSKVHKRIARAAEDELKVIVR